ncbi:MAG: tetratricopeptide repeat protein, partial [Pseudomonadota bacterium]
DLFRSTNSNVENGNTKLEGGKPEEALKFYEKAAKQLPDEPGVQYNRGIALQKLGKYQEAKQAFLKATTAGDHSLSAKSSYNLGNAFFQLKKYKEAADSYRRSLRFRPKHQPSKWNLELALRRIQEDKKKQDKQNKKDKQDKRGKQNKKDKQQKSENPKEKKDDKKKGQEQNQPQPQEKDKEDPHKKTDERKMNQTLDALDRNDKNLQRRRARLRYGGTQRQPTKDW